MNDKSIMNNIMNDIVNDKKGHSIVNEKMLCSWARRLICRQTCCCTPVLMESANIRERARSRGVQHCLWLLRFVISSETPRKDRSDHWRIQRVARDARPSRFNFFHFLLVFRRKFAKQECIPGGCIPPAAVAIHERWVCLSACWDTQPPHVGLETPLGVGLETPPQLSPWVWAWRPPMQGMLGYHLPLHPVNRMTDRCKNITLPQTSFAGGNNRLVHLPPPVPRPMFVDRDRASLSGESWI